MAGAVSAEVTAYAGRIDTATDRIAAELTGLAEQLANAGTVEEVKAILEPVVTKLEATGTQPGVS